MFLHVQHHTKSRTSNSVEVKAKTLWDLQALEADLLDDSLYILIFL